MIYNCHTVRFDKAPGHQQHAAWRPVSIPSSAGMGAKSHADRLASKAFKNCYPEPQEKIETTRLDLWHYTFRYAL